MQNVVFSLPDSGSVPLMSCAFQRLPPPLSPMPAMRQPSTPNARCPPLRFDDWFGGSSVVLTVPTRSPVPFAFSR